MANCQIKKNTSILLA